MKNVMRARKGGFTLVELLIVIMIIAILAGMMMLATGSATDSAEATKIINDLRNVKAAALMYFVDKGTWPHDNVGDGQVISDEAFNPYLDRVIKEMLATEDNVQRKNGVAGAEAELEGKVLYRMTPKAFTSNTSTTSGVRKKLIDNAKKAGLYDGTSGNKYYDGGNLIAIVIK